MFIAGEINHFLKKHLFFFKKKKLVVYLFVLIKMNQEFKLGKTVNFANIQIFLFFSLLNISFEFFYESCIGILVK